MQLRSGTYEIGPANGSVRLHTGRQGAAARAGHDLVIEAQRWTATVVVDTARVPRSSLTASVETRSLRVLEGSGGALPLSEGQIQDIERNMHAEVLHSDAHPEVTFHSTAVSGDRGGARVVGDLTLAGVTRPATLNVTVRERREGVRLAGSLTVSQTAHGIKLYSALMGALKVSDEVRVAVDVLLDTR